MGSKRFVEKLGITATEARVLRLAYCRDGKVNLTEMGGRPYDVVKRLVYKWGHGRNRFLTTPDTNGDCQLTKRGRATAAALCAWQMEWNRTGPRAGSATTEASRATS